MSRAFSSTAASPTCFSAKEFRKFPVTHVKVLNHDSKVLRMSLPTRTSSTGLKVSSLVMVKGKHDTDVRPYTPITLKEDLGYFELLVKSYPQGTVSRHLHSLAVGEEV